MNKKKTRKVIKTRSKILFAFDSINYQYTSRILKWQKIQRKITFNPLRSNKKD